MSFEVMVSVKALGTLVTFERAFIHLGLLLAGIDGLHVSAMPAIESTHYPTGHVIGHAADDGHLATGAMDVGHNWACHASTVHSR